MGITVLMSFDWIFLALNTFAMTFALTFASLRLDFRLLLPTFADFRRLSPTFADFRRLSPKKRDFRRLSPGFRLSPFAILEKWRKSQPRRTNMNGEGVLFGECGQDQKRRFHTMRDSKLFFCLFWQYDALRLARSFTLRRLSRYKCKAKNGNVYHGLMAMYYKKDYNFEKCSITINLLIFPHFQN